MCGIAGYIDKVDKEINHLNKMIKVIENRGPDSSEFGLIKMVYISVILDYQSWTYQKMVVSQCLVETKDI